MTVNRYDHFNAIYHARQHQTASSVLRGWRAWHASQAGGEYTQQVHSQAWMTGWRTAAGGGPMPRGKGVMLDLCPGVLEPMAPVPLDPNHVAGDLVWACNHCGWRIAAVAGARPPHVPIHPFVKGAKGASPIGGPGVDTLEDDR